MSLKNDLSNHIEEIADLLEFLEENKFKISAFRTGAGIIKHLDEDLEILISEDRLKDVKGIGKGLMAVILEFYDNGYSTEHENLLNRVPEGLTELFQIRGLGSKKIKSLHNHLNISTLHELEEKCRRGIISSLKGFGEKTQDNILSEIIRIKIAEGFVHIHRAQRAVDFISAELKKIKSVKDFMVTGDLRRGNEVISDISICLLVTDKEYFLKEVANFFILNKIDDSYEDAYVLDFEVKVMPKIYLASDRLSYIERIVITTGSKDFLESLELNNSIKFTTEKEYFEKNNVPYIIPEMREREYVDAPKQLKDNTDLSLSDFKALLHFHTTSSDGVNSLKDMVNEAKIIGFAYAAVCDHSKSAFYAHGLSGERILLQKKEITEVNSENIIPIFHGIESDILSDGSLDYKEEILTSLDFIVASIHSNFHMNEKEMTARIIKAIENPFTDVLGHPTGRLLLTRDPYPHNIHKIIDACVQNQVAIEINANPHRLDLDWRHIYYARERGCKFSINADAHQLEGLLDINYGIKIARKGGITKDEVINCLGLAEFKKFLNRKVSRKFNL